MGKTCPKCGYIRKPTDYAPDYECPACGIIYSKFVSGDATNQATSAPIAERKDAPKRRKRHATSILVAIVVAAVGISFLGFKLYQDAQKRKALREFAAFQGAVSGKLVTLGAKSEEIVGEINRDWRQAIFSEYQKRDFNEAIAEVRERRSRDIVAIKKLSDEIARDIRGVSPPVGKETNYQRLRDIYLLFNKYADMAVSPSGSLQTYSQQNSQLTVEIKSAIRELELIK